MVCSKSKGKCTLWDFSNFSTGFEYWDDDAQMETQDSGNERISFCHDFMLFSSGDAPKKMYIYKPNYLCIIISRKMMVYIVRMSSSQSRSE